MAETTEPRRVRRLELPVRGGEVIFSWPEPIDLDDIKDVRESLQITLASIERRAERKHLSDEAMAHVRQDAAEALDEGS